MKLHFLMGIQGLCTSQVQQTANGKLVVWGPGGWDSNRVPLSQNPFHKGIPNIQTTNLPLAEGMKKNLYHLESRWLSHVLVYQGPLQIATFWEWLGSHLRTHVQCKKSCTSRDLQKHKI